MRKQRTKRKKTQQRNENQNNKFSTFYSIHAGPGRMS